MELESVQIESLRPYERNSRTHSRDQIAQIVASIQEFGWTNPILIDEANGIIAGHGRLEAARQCGLTDVPCVRLHGLTDAQKRAYVIADNQLALNAGWDVETLKSEVEALLADEFELDLLGFDAGFLADLLDDEGDAAEPPPPPGEPAMVSEQGDVWQLDDHYLTVGTEVAEADVIVRHWQTQTGRRAVLVKTGELFA